MDQTTPQGDTPVSFNQGQVHNKIGVLTRQLHDALRELGLADRLQGSARQLPDAQNRLTYIARLTGEAAEKVLTLVDDAKERQSSIVDETKAMRKAMIADPVAAVAKGHIMNYLEDMEKATEIVDNQLTDIMMAQDFHDLTGQVIAKVVTLAANLENQLVELLLQTAPASATNSAAVASAAAAMAASTAAAQPAETSAPDTAVSSDQADDLWAAALAESAPAASASALASAAPEHPALNGPVVDPANTPDVVTSQSQVDDLLASLGF